MKKQKYYVVWKGVHPGIYKEWDEAKKQIFGFEGALYKSFATEAEAQKAYKDNAYQHIGGQARSKANSVKKIGFDDLINKGVISRNSICVDAACSGNPGDMEYRCVTTVTGKELFRMGPYAMGTNNVGEFLGLVHALAMCKQKEKDDVIIYSDSKTAISWLKNKNAKTKLDKLQENKEIFELLERAQMWLLQNTYQNKVIHWNTPEWGEIPADFGRK